MNHLGHTPSATFGNLRALMNQPKPLQESWKAELRAHITHAKERFPKLYDARWVPYLEGFSLLWGSFCLQKATSLEELAPWREIAPFALFGLDLSQRRNPWGTGKITPNFEQFTQLHSLNLRGCHMHDTGAKFMSQAPHLHTLRQLDLGYNLVSEEGLALLIQSACFDHLTHLDLSGNELPTKGLPHTNLLSCLESLSLDNCALTPEMLRFGQSPHLKRLEHLRLSNNTLTKASVHALCDNSKLESLRDLELNNCALDDATLETLIHATPFKLHSLGLANNSISALNITQLLHSPQFASLRHLDLTSTQSISKIFPSPTNTTHHLNSLNISSNRLDGGMTSMLQTLPHLSHLNLQNTSLTHQDLKALFESTHTCLKHVNLSSNRVSDNLLEKALSQTSPRLELHTLELAGVLLDDKNFQLLLRSPLLVSLKTLDLSFYGLQTSNIIALAASPNLRSLETLQLHNTKLADAAIDALLNSNTLNSLETLDLKHATLSPKATAMLAEATHLRVIL